MFIDSISLENVRTFAAEKTVRFNHPDKEYPRTAGRRDSPKLKNVNLVFGENASGKTTLLEAIALAALGPAIVESGVRPRPLVRFIPSKRKPSSREKAASSRIAASFTLEASELSESAELFKGRSFDSELIVRRKGELESFNFEPGSKINWSLVYESNNTAFFIAAYGATRRLDTQAESFLAKRNSSNFSRLDRIESIVQAEHSLTPLPMWFGNLKKGTDRWDEIVDLINRSLGGKHFSFEGKRKDGDYVFSQGGLDIPFRSLSDGYRAFLGWVTDLLYHLDLACKKPRASLASVSGVVLVDEIDLHLHPRWQMEVVGHLSKAFPRLQFIFTSHSPLIAGAVEMMNITHLNLDNQHRTGVRPLEEPIHGLDADQILLTDLFGLKTTRAPSKERRLEELTIRARGGDDDAARMLIAELARGMEDEQ